MIRTMILVTIVLQILILIGIFGLYFGGDDSNGKAYENKLSMCSDFAQSYLKTVKKTDNIADFSNEKWIMATDVETDMYNLCLTDLDKEALNRYTGDALKKYK